jgi:hypothetical protein
MLKQPNEEGVELYDLDYAQALVKTKLGESSLFFMPSERVDTLVADMYALGYMMGQAHDDDAIKTLGAAFVANQSIVIEKADLFGTLRFLRPSDALSLLMDEASKAGLPSAFLSGQFEKLVDGFYGSGILLTHCGQEPARHWFADYHRRNSGNPTIRLRPQPKPEQKPEQKPELGLKP